MRALALGSDVIVFVSSYWQTGCTAIRAGDEGFLIDSLVYPDELEALPARFEGIFRRHTSRMSVSGTPPSTA